MEEVFGATGNVSWYQECARSVLIFAYGLALVRISGRRIFGKWSALDIIVSIIIGSNLSRALTGGAPLWGTLAATTLFVSVHWILANLVSRSASVSRVIEGLPIELARSGSARTSVFRRHSISESDLQEALRQSGVENLAAATVVTLEPSGRITVLRP
jgi:uncharacterized membrane protein YcaP (DUF421 family)